MTELEIVKNLQRLREINLDPLEFFKEELKTNKKISPERENEWRKLYNEVCDLMGMTIQK